MDDMQGFHDPAATGSDEIGSFLFIGELAKRTGIDPKTIRFYERADLLSPPRHGKFRTYLASDVRRLESVLKLRRLGVPIAQIRNILAVAEDGRDVFEAATVGDVLRGHLEVLRRKQDELSRQIADTASVLEQSAA